MQNSSPTPPTLLENFQMLPISTSTISDVTSTIDTSYPSLLLKKKLAMFEHSSPTVDNDVSNETINSSASTIKSSNASLPSTNENEPVKSASRRRKPLRPWSLSARVERPNSTVQSNIEPISDNDDEQTLSEMKHSPVSSATTNSNLNEDENMSNSQWTKELSTIEEILKLYRVETDGSVQCIRCGCHANQDNLLEHVSVHYPYKCYTCGFYCDSSLRLDEHNEIHTSNIELKVEPIEETPIVIPKSEPITNSTSEKAPSSSSKTKVHRCRQCSYVSNVKEEYWAHHRVYIRADKILECPSCPFVTEYKHHLEYHLRNHLGSKPFKCSKCDYACVNLSMLRSHKKSHYRHLLFKCSNCSFESKQYPTLQEHLQIEGHEPYVDENIEEFLREYSSGNLTSLNTISTTNTNSSHSPPTLVQKSTFNRGSTSKKRKSTPSLVKRTDSIRALDSISSIESSQDMISPISTDEQQQQIDPLNSSSLPLVCTLCDYVAVSKEGLGVHLFQHACKNSDLLNRSLLASATMDPTAKLMELFNGKMGPFTGNTGQLNDFLGPYQQFLTQQIQSHLSSPNFPSYPLDNNNNPSLPPSLLNNGNYSLLSSCRKSESNENTYPPAKRQRKDDENTSNTTVDQQTQVDEWQIKRLFECFHCEIIFKDFAMYCTHKQLHYSPENPFRCAQCGEQKTNKYDFFVHVAQQAHELT